MIVSGGVVRMYKYKGIFITDNLQTKGEQTEKIFKHGKNSNSTHQLSNGIVRIFVSE